MYQQFYLSILPRLLTLKAEQLLEFLIENKSEYFNKKQIECDTIIAIMNCYFVEQFKEKTIYALLAVMPEALDGQE
jgi:hypothetical protein